MIDDEAYYPSLEGRAANHFNVINALVRSGVNAEELGMENFLCALQDAHDVCLMPGWSRDIHPFESRMAWIADAYDLNYKPEKIHA